MKVQTHKERSEYLKSQNGNPFAGPPLWLFCLTSLDYCAKRGCCPQYADHMDVKALSMIIGQSTETGPFPHAAGRGRFLDNRDRADVSGGSANTKERTRAQCPLQNNRVIILRYLGVICNRPHDKHQQGIMSNGK